ncbi:MAG: septum formation protein Maf [Clostridia bacterium]|nr:septum formation protein Maf [Clostridia bacterium]
MNIILASKSPRRQELMKLITPFFSVDVPQNEENCPESVPLFSRPQYLAEQKGKEVAARHNNAIVIAADTAVFYGDKMLGKPRDLDEARAMLKLLSGNTHTVITGCSIVCGDTVDSFSVSTEVEFLPLSDEMVEEYLSYNESMDKAGAYGIQGRGAVLVRGIRGDYFNVVGLPVCELNLHLRERFKALKRIKMQKI